jgi:hypothetical protein
MMNLCITCSHFELHPDSKDPELGLCRRIPPTVSLVTGKPIAKPDNFCNVERLAHNPCGLFGAFYLPITIPFATQAEVNELLTGDSSHV